MTTVQTPKDGVYLVRFHGPGGSDFGTAVLERGRIHGGDTSYYYVGSFTSTDTGMIALDRVGKHEGGKSARSAMGHLTGERLKLAGTVNGDTFLLEASLSNGARFSIQASLSSDLDDQGSE